MNVVAHEGEALPDAVRWLLVGAVALTLITMGLQELTLHPHPDEPTDHRVSVPLKIGAAVAALALGFTGLGATVLLSLLLALLLVQMIYGAVVWFRTAPKGYRAT